MKVIVVALTVFSFSASFAEPPISSYLPPNYSTMSQSSFAPPPPSSYSAPSNSYSAPSSYRAPAKSYSAPSSSYGSPSRGYESSAPANYEFNYHVLDSASRNDFGHKETRQGDVARGKYFVLLPDGRKQIVEYVADSQGYRPTITYEGGSTSSGGYSGGGYRY